MCEERGLKWLHYPLSGKNCLGAPLADSNNGCAVSGDPHQPKKQNTDTISLTTGVEAVANLLREGESVIVHCDTGVQRSGIVAYLAMRHCGLGPDKSLELLGNMRPIAMKEMLKGEPSLQQQAEMRLYNSQWQPPGGESLDSGVESKSREQQRHLPQKKRVSWAEGESLQTVSFLPPTPRALILRALEMVNLVDYSEEGCSDGGPRARAFFQASLLRLQSWVDGDSDAIRPNYSNRYGKPVPYWKDYTRGWSVLAGLYKDDAAKLFAAVTGGGDGLGLLKISARTLPYVHSALEITQEGGACGLEGAQVLADALFVLRDDTGLAPAAGLEPDVKPLGQENSTAHNEEENGQQRDEKEDESIFAISAICSALDALYDERKHQQHDREIAATRDLVVSRLEEQQARRDQLLAQLGLSDDSDSE